MAKSREFVPEYVPDAKEEIITHPSVRVERIEKIPYRPHRGRKSPNKGAYAFKWIEELQVLVEKDEHGKVKAVLQDIGEKYKLLSVDCRG